MRCKARGGNVLARGEGALISRVRPAPRGTELRSARCRERPRGRASPPPRRCYCALTPRSGPGPGPGPGPSKDQIAAGIRPGRLAQAQAAAERISATGRRVSRRTLRAAGVRASNAELGALAITLTSARKDSGR
jgi:hypothetical protein